MVTNRRTDFDPEDDGPAFDPLAGIDTPARPEPPKPDTIKCISIPNYAVDRRHDVRARDYSSTVTLPYRDGWFTRFAQMAEPGYYFGELRASNQIVPGGDVFEVKPGGRLGETTSAPPALTLAATNATPAAPALPESSTAQSIKALTEAVREAKGFAQEMAPPPAPPQPTENVEAVVERALTKQREEFTRMLAEMKATQPAAPVAPVEKPKTLSEQLRELKESRELLGEIVGNPQRGEQPDPFKQFMTTYEMVMELTDRVAPDRGGGGDASWFDKGMRVLDRHGETLKEAFRQGPALLAAMRPGRVQEMAQATGMDTAPAQVPQAGAQPQPAAAPQPARPQPPQNEQEALMLIAHVGANELAFNRRVGHTADLIDEQVRRFPKLAEFVREFVAMPPADALALFMQLTGRTDLAALNHSISFIENLQDDLRPDDGDEQSDDTPTGDAPNILNMAAHAKAS